MVQILSLGLMVATLFSTIILAAVPAERLIERQNGCSSVVNQWDIISEVWKTTWTTSQITKSTATKTTTSETLSPSVVAYTTVLPTSSPTTYIILKTTSVLSYYTTVTVLPTYVPTSYYTTISTWAPTSYTTVLTATNLWQVDVPQTLYRTTTTSTVYQVPFLALTTIYSYQTTCTPTAVQKPAPT